MKKISKIKEIESIQEESLDELLNHYMKKEFSKESPPEERPRGLTCFRRPKKLSKEELSILSTWTGK